MYLITTPIEKKFYNELSEFIYQGSWCNDNSEDNSHKIVPYHWSNIHLRHIDLQKIESVYERILTLMTNKLNILHGENYTKEYWRIIIGVWLYSFISTIFDRYKCLLESKKINIKSVFISDYPNNLSILNTFSEFWSKVRTDEYNSLIFSDIVKVSNVLPYKIINIIKRQNLQNNDIVNNKYNETLHELVNKKVLFFNSRLTRKIKLLISTSNHSVLDFFIQTENDGKISFV